MRISAISWVSSLVVARAPPSLINSLPSSVFSSPQVPGPSSSTNNIYVCREKVAEKKNTCRVVDVDCMEPLYAMFDRVILVKRDHIKAFCTSL